VKVKESKATSSPDRTTPATKPKEKEQSAKASTRPVRQADIPMPKNTKETENTTDTKAAPAKLPTASPAQEQHLQDLLSELEGKSETAQRPIIDEILLLGPATIKTLSKALNSGATFQVRMASATALGELGDERCVEPLVQALADTSLNVQRAAAHALSLLGQPAVDPLLESLDSPDDSVRRWASEVLGKAGAQGCGRRTDQPPRQRNRRSAKSDDIALGELGSAKATVPLIGFLHSEKHRPGAFRRRSAGPSGR
jgi:HEAT repeat protein